LFDACDEGAARHAEDFGGSRLVAVALFERGDDAISLERRHLIAKRT
jgi:hypothetical protein